MSEPATTDLIRQPFRLADFSEGTAADKELGVGKSDVWTFVDGVDGDGQPTLVRQGVTQPRGFHWMESEDPLDPALPLLKDKRVGPALVADYEHAFSGFRLGPGPAGNPAGNDWDFEQRSTRCYDYNDPQGNVALFAQLAKVLDDHFSEFSLAIPHGPAILGGGQPLLPPDADPPIPDGGGNAEPVDFLGHPGEAGAGLFWDGEKAGLTATLLAPIHDDDVMTSGLLGTQIGVQGLRRNAHFEWDDKHGPLFLSKTELSANPGRGPIFVAALRHDASVALSSGPPGSPTGQWRAYYRQPYFTPEDETLIPGPDGDEFPPDGPPGTGPGDDGGGSSSGDGILPPLDPYDPVGTPDPDPVVLIIPGLTPAGLGFPHGPTVVLGSYVSPEKQGYLGFLTGRGTDSDRTVMYALQGANTAGQAWGMTLSADTQIGADKDEDPLLRFGHGSDSRRFEMQFDSSLGSGRMKLGYYDSGDALIDEQIDICAAVDMQNTSGTSIYSWSPDGSFALSKAGAEIGGEPTGATTFAGKWWFGSDGDNAELVYRSLSNTKKRTKLFDDPESPDFTGTVTCDKLTCDVVDPYALIFDAVATIPTEFNAGNHGLWVDSDDDKLYYWDGTTSTDLTAAGSGYSTIEEEGTPVTQRSTLNVVGSALTVLDSGGKTQLATGTRLNDIVDASMTKGAILAHDGSSGLVSVVPDNGGADDGQILVADVTAGTAGTDFSRDPLEFTPQPHRVKRWGIPQHFIGTSAPYGHEIVANSTSYAVSGTRLLTMNTAASANDDAYVATASEVIQANRSPRFLTYILMPATITNMRMQVGLTKTKAGAGTEQGWYFRFDPSVSANWFAVTRDGSGETTTDTGIAASASGNFKLEIRRDTNTGNVTFHINDTEEADHSTNLLVSDDLFLFALVRATTSASRQVRVRSGWMWSDTTIN